MGKVCSNSSIQNSDPEPCLWYKICINTKNAQEKARIQGLYRRVEFIDVPISTISHHQISRNDYHTHYQSSNQVYVRVYNDKFREIDQKREFIFLYNNGEQWIFSNYESLYYYVGIKLGPQYVIKAETNTEDTVMLSNEYPIDLDQLKMMKKIKYQNEAGISYKLTIKNTYMLNQESGKIKDASALVLKHCSHSENNLLRESFRVWRENINVFYERSQLLTKQQIKDEQIRQNNKNKADQVRGIIRVIDAVCLSNEFRNLMKKYKNKSQKMNGWIHRDNGFKRNINDGTYAEFCKEYIQRKKNDQLAFDFVKDVALEYNKYYNGLWSELQNLENEETLK